MPSDLDPLALDDAAFHRQLVDRPAHRFAGDLLVREGHLEEDPSRLDVGHPPFRRTLAGTHPGLGRLLGDRLVREHGDPDLAATADVPRHGDTGRLDLPVGQVRRFQRLDAELAERHPGTALRRTVPVRVVRLAEALRGLARHQHWSALLLFDRCRRSGAGFGTHAGRLRRNGPAGFGAAGRGTRRTGAQPPRTVGPLGPLPPRARWPRLGRCLAARYGVTLVDPGLHTDAAEGGTRLEEAVLDVGPQRVQRYPALAVELRAGHLGSAQAAGALHPDALHERVLHRRLHRLAHRPAEADPGRELLGDRLRNELRVRLRALHLQDVQLHLLAGQLLQRATDPVGLGALAADDDARSGGVDVDAYPVAGALDVHFGDSGALQVLGHHLADLDVLRDVVLVQLVGVPPALPVGRDAEPEPVRVNLLTHYSVSSSADSSASAAAALVAAAFLAAVFFAALVAFFARSAVSRATSTAGLFDSSTSSVAGSAFLAGAAFFAGAAAFLPGTTGRDGAALAPTDSTTMVMWQVRLRMRYARPCARGRNRFSVGPSSTYASATSNASGSSRSLFSAFAIALASTLYTGTLAACGANCSTVNACCAGRPRTRLTTRRAFVAEMRTCRATARAPGSATSLLVGIGCPVLYPFPGPPSGGGSSGRPSRGPCT